MSGAQTRKRGASPFSRGAVLAVVLVGFLSFFAMLYFIGAGDTGERSRGGPAHAAANGLNGFSGFYQLLEAEGYDVERSRSREGFDTYGLLVLTPPATMEASELAAVLNNREYIGPTLVIMPKWFATRPGRNIAEEDEDRVQSDWVELVSASAQEWSQDLPAPYTFAHQIEFLDDDEEPYWSGLDEEGVLPTKTILYAEDSETIQPLVTDAAGHVLAFNVLGEEGGEYYENAHWTIFVTEPDLLNNYGMADPDRAAVAIKLVEQLGYDEVESVTFDLSLHGIGPSTNLLTLAFQPPFLAATLCMILAMMIIGWRAFLRFGPNTVAGPEIAFGKQRLVSNGAGLIVRAKRLGLLAGPYVALNERRLARDLGITHPDAEQIDKALAIRLPDEEPFSHRAARLQNATRPIEILRAASALNDLHEKLTGKRLK